MKTFEPFGESTDWNMAIAFLKRIDENCKEIDLSIKTGAVEDAYRMMRSIIASVKPIFADRKVDFTPNYQKIDNMLKPASSNVRGINREVAHIAFSNADEAIIKLYEELCLALYKANLIFGKVKNQTPAEEFAGDY